MTMLTAVALLAVELGGAFGGAGVTGSEAGKGMIEIELTVRVAPSDGPVLAHLSLPGEALLTIPMLDQGDGTWVTVEEVRAADWQVVFEAVTAGELSEPVSFTGLGLDPTVLGVSSPDPGPGPDAEPRPPGWGRLALALAAGGLAIGLAVYGSGSFRPRHRRSPR
jgi:hypothetical protein